MIVEQVRSLVKVGDVLSNWLAVHVAVSVHARSLVVVGATV